MLNGPSLIFSEKTRFFADFADFSLDVAATQAENEETQTGDAADDEVRRVGTGEARGGDERDFERFRDVANASEKQGRGVNEEHMEDVKAETRSRKERRKTRRTVDVTLGETEDCERRRPSVNVG